MKLKLLTESDIHFDPDEALPDEDRFIEECTVCGAKNDLYVCYSCNTKFCERCMMERMNAGVDYVDQGIRLPDGDTTYISSCEYC